MLGLGRLEKAWPQNRYDVVAQVHVVRARLLRNADEDGSSDPYASVSFLQPIAEDNLPGNAAYLIDIGDADDPEYFNRTVYSLPESNRTKLIRDQPNPLWNEKLYFILHEEVHNYKAGIPLNITIYHGGSIAPVSLGTVNLEIRLDAAYLGGKTSRPKKQGGWFTLDKGEGATVEFYVQLFYMCRDDVAEESLDALFSPVRQTVSPRGQSRHKKSYVFDSKLEQETVRHVMKPEQGLDPLHTIRRKIEHLIGRMAKNRSFRPRSMTALHSTNLVLVIDVIEARDLMAADVLGASDPYVVMEVISGDREFMWPRKQRTKFIKQTLQPNFNERFTFLMSDDVPIRIKFSMYDHDYGNDDDDLGYCIYDSASHMGRFSTSANSEEELIPVPEGLEDMPKIEEVFRIIQPTRRWEKLQIGANGIFFYSYFKIPCDLIFSNLTSSLHNV